MLSLVGGEKKAKRKWRRIFFLSIFNRKYFCWHEIGRKMWENKSKRTGNGNCAMNNKPYHEIPIYNHSFPPRSHNVSCIRLPVTQPKRQQLFCAILKIAPENVKCKRHAKAVLVVTSLGIILCFIFMCNKQQHERKCFYGAD